MPETLTVSLAQCTETPTWPVEQVRFEDHATEQRYLRSSVPKRVWQCVTPMISSAAMNTLKSFHAARYGSYDAFNWTSPLDSTSYLVKFQQGTFQVTSDQGSTRFQVAFTLEAVTD